MNDKSNIGVGWPQEAVLPRLSQIRTCGVSGCFGFLRIVPNIGQDLWPTRVKSIIRLGAPWGRVPGRWRKLHPHLQEATGPCAHSPSIDAIAIHVE